MNKTVLHIKPGQLNLKELNNRLNDTELPGWQRSIYQFLSDWPAPGEYFHLKTSGSTGTPKKIRVKKAQMITSARMTGNFFDFRKGMTVLNCLPTDFIAGKMMLVRALVWEMSIIAVEPTLSPLEIIQEKIDFAAMTPPQAEASIDKLALIDTLIIGGAAVSPVLHSKLQDVPTQCYATYGMTETLSHVALQKLNNAHSSTYFKGLGGVTFTRDERDCLKISAPGLLDKSIITNDVVLLNEDGGFKWLGRFDHVINSGGVKLHPENIEKKLDKFIKKPFFIAGIPDKKWGEVPVLITEGSQNQNLSIAYSSLDKIEIPKNIYAVDHFERTPNGKIKRKSTLRLIFG